MNVFKDHFSDHAAQYRDFRPRYQEPLFRFLADLAPSRNLAWDCATGNGQAAVALARHFDSVIATDASREQIENAEPHDCVSYAVARAESVSIAARSVDLVTIAQALHWFEFAPFYEEVRRVAVDGGIVCAWAYELHRITPEIDAQIDHLYREVVGKYWPPERRHIQEGYATIPFPFERIESPSLRMEERWDLDTLLGYLSTWSAVRRYFDDTGRDPIKEIGSELASIWGDPVERRRVTWPLVILSGRVS